MILTQWVRVRLKVCFTIISEHFLEYFLTRFGLQAYLSRSAIFQKAFSKLLKYILKINHKQVAGIPNILSSYHSTLSPLCMTQPIGQFLSLMKSLRTRKSLPFIFLANFISMGRIPFEDSIIRSISAPAPVR